MSIAFTQIRTKLYKIPNLRYVTDNMNRFRNGCYRSRIPFLSDADVCDASWLISTCCVPLDKWHEFSSYTVRDKYALAVTGTCTDRSRIFTADYITAYLNATAYNMFGVQVNLVNVTNKAQYPVIASYLTDNADWEVIRRTTTRRGDKPVDFIIARRGANVGNNGGTTVRYVCFTTFWDYDLNKSLLYVMLNHMLTTPFENEAFNRTTTNRVAYTWFSKYFEGQDVTSSILEYLDRELISKLSDIAKTQLKESLNKFGNLKAAFRDQTEARIQAERERIREYERYIVNSYDNIRQYTLSKLKQENQGGALDTLLGIFGGMLNKDVLTGFCYRTDGTDVSRVAWRVQLPITYWEEDEAKYWLRELRYDEYKKDLFKAMFMDKLIVPYCEQTISIHLTNGRVSNEALDIDVGSSVYPPHPHIGIYNCFGNNANAAMKAIMQQDFVTAVTICMNAAMQLNMTDHTVTSRFMSMCNYGGDYSSKAFLLYRGKMYTPDELYNLYKLEGGFHNGETNQITEETTEQND